MEIKGQAAIVTGGASGLGAATARALAAAGAKVAIFDVNEKGRRRGRRRASTASRSPATWRTRQPPKRR